MEALSEDEIVALFSRQVRRELAVPDLAPVDWGVLDYFGWIHPSGHQGYVVYPCANAGVDGLVGLKLNRYAPPPTKRRGRMCSWCNHMHHNNGTAMYSTTVAGTDGRRIVGNVMCRNLDCSLRIRNLCSDPPSSMPETIDLTRKIHRLESALNTFVARVKPNQTA